MNGGRWECPLCTYDNFSASIKCSMCSHLRACDVIIPPPSSKEGKDSKEFIISPRTFPQTSSEFEVPEKNLNAKNLGLVNFDERSATNNWHCLVCLSDNNGDTEWCGSCDSPRAAVVSEQSEKNAKNGKWNCGKCTYANWQVSRKCVMCQRSRADEKSLVDKFSECVVVPGSPKGRSRSSSSSSGSSQNDLSTQRSKVNRNRRQNTDNQACSSRTTGACGSNRNATTGGHKIMRSSSRHDLDNRRRNLNWLFLKACIGVVDDTVESVDSYLLHGGNVARSLTADEVSLLNRPSAFDVGHTLVHLSIRFQRHPILALLLNPQIAPRAFKRNPSHLSPDIAELIRRQISASLRTRKGDFHCRFLSECTTFQLPVEICDLPPTIQKLLFNELLDQDVQKELEEEAVINWSSPLLRAGDNRLYALWNRSAGDCLLDSVLQSTWGVFDRENTLRSAMSDSLQDCATSFFKRWKDWELRQASLAGFTLTERQCLQDWAFIHSLAQQPGASLEHCHIFVLCHVLRRPVIVYGVKYLKSFRGETLGYANFQGVYLPFLWDAPFCFTNPIVLGYTRGHFTSLVTMEDHAKDIGSIHRSSFNEVKHLPLVDSEGKVLPVHFTPRGEVCNEEERKNLLLEWLDCDVTEHGVLVAKQRAGKRPPSVTRMTEHWLDHYRHLSFVDVSDEEP